MKSENRTHHIRWYRPGGDVWLCVLAQRREKVNINYSTNWKTHSQPASTLIETKKTGKTAQVGPAVFSLVGYRSEQVASKRARGENNSNDSRNYHHYPPINA